MINTNTPSKIKKKVYNNLYNNIKNVKYWAKKYKITKLSIK
jgi:hypothetical protein